MSDTDDTDDLLLIPPDFFLIDTDIDPPYSKNFGPYYKVVDSLITQVTKLENRISSIENTNSADLSFSNSLDSSLGTKNMQNTLPQNRKYRSSDDMNVASGYNFNSTQSTPQRPRTRFRLNSLPSSPNVERFSPRQKSYDPKSTKPLNTERPNSKSPHSINGSPRRTANTQSDGVLDEIDNFISNVKKIQRFNAARNLESDFAENLNDKRKVVVDDIDEMMKNMELQQKQSELRLREKEKELSMNNDFKSTNVYREVSRYVAANLNRGDTEIEPAIIKDKTWKQGENIESVPDYNFGVRKAMYSNSEASVGPNESISKTSVSKSYSMNSGLSSNIPESTGTRNEKSNSDSETSQATVLNRYGGVEYNSDFGNAINSNALNAINSHKKLLSHLSEGGTFADRGLVSLSELWTRNCSQDFNSATFIQKIQEEKLRRQHCEDLIQELQNKSLELQERLAVAVQVDEVKDDAILKLHNAYENIKEKFLECNKEKTTLQQEIDNLQLKNNKELEEATLKVSHYENEASKALNLAHGNQEKLAYLENRCTNLQEELNTIERNLQEVQKNYSLEVDQNRKLSEIIAKKELELSEGKKVLEEARQEIAQSKKAIEVCQTEFSDMKAEYNNLDFALKDKNYKLQEFEKQKKKLLEEIEAQKKVSRTLQEELNKSREQMDNNKIELKNFYQGQVEIVVQNKLKEFQRQLDDAETSFREELKNKELAIAKTAASHIQQIAEKYSLEIKLIEEKHQEEVRLYEIRLTQYQQQIQEMGVKFQKQQEKRDQVAQQLRKVMESQWIEALRIISNGRSPMVQDETRNAVDQLNSLKSRSYNNLEEVLALQLPNDETETSANHRRKPSKDLRSNAQTSRNKTYFDESAQEQTGQETYRVQNETPLSSRTQVAKADSDLQKYIQMLLNKQPGNPTDETELDSANFTQYDRANGQNQERQESKGTVRDRRGKPPWKY